MLLKKGIGIGGYPCIPVSDYPAHPDGGRQPGANWSQSYKKKKIKKKRDLRSASNLIYLSHQFFVKCTLKFRARSFRPFISCFCNKRNSFGVFGVFPCYRMNNDTELAPITRTRCLYAQVTSALDVYRKHLFSALTFAVRWYRNTLHMTVRGKDTDSQQHPKPLRLIRLRVVRPTHKIRMRFGSIRASVPGYSAASMLRYKIAPTLNLFHTRTQIKQKLKSYKINPSILIYPLSPLHISPSHSERRQPQIFCPFSSCSSSLMK